MFKHFKINLFYSSFAGPNLLGEGGWGVIHPSYVEKVDLVRQTVITRRENFEWQLKKQPNALTAKNDIMTNSDLVLIL